jgi:hypothetical protein
MFGEELATISTTDCTSLIDQMINAVFFLNSKYKFLCLALDQFSKGLFVIQKRLLLNNDLILHQHNNANEVS